MPRQRKALAGTAQQKTLRVRGGALETEMKSRAGFFNLIGIFLPCLWIVIALSFMTTAGTNWHPTILDETAFLAVDVDNPSVRTVFGMLTHIAFFVGELNWSFGVTHLMSSLGFAPAIAIAPAVSMVSSFVFMLKLDMGGPTGLPIHGPPAPVPEIAMTVGIMVNINVLYQFFCAPAGEAVILASTATQVTQKHYKPIYLVAYLLIIGVPHALAKYQRMTLPDCRGVPVVR